jgi:hypothetical protein
MYPLISPEYIISSSHSSNSSSVTIISSLGDTYNDVDDVDDVVNRFNDVNDTKGDDSIGTLYEGLIDNDFDIHRLL